MNHAPPPSVPSPSSTTSDKLNVHQRRLQLRNAGFRAAALPNRRPSPSYIVGSEDEYKENRSSSPPSSLAVHSETLLSHPPSILHQIHNSSQRRSMQRPSLTALFEDDKPSQRRESISATLQDCLGGRRLSPHSSFRSLFRDSIPNAPQRQASFTSILQSTQVTRSPDDSPTVSWLQGSQNDPDFVIYNSDIDDNSRPQSSRTSVRPTSPRAQRIRGRTSNRNLKSPTREDADYIERLETDLAAAQRKGKKPVAPEAKMALYIDHLEAKLAASEEELGRFTSATAKRQQAARAKKLMEENSDLKQELMDWRNQFDARLEEEAARLRDDAVRQIDLLKSRISTLERETEIKDGRLGELEWEMEMSSQKLRRAEELDETNRGLERRVDVLTELLALSPARTDFSHPSTFGPPSPQRDRVRIQPRPRSMLPRLPSSEQVSYFHTDPDPNHLSVRPTLYPAWSDFHVPYSSPDGQADVDDAHDESLPNGFDDTMSLSSTLISKSQRSSMFSNGPLSPNAFHLLPTFHADEKLKSPRGRCMRKFPAGSGQLKSLILPTAATCTMSVPNSAMHAPGSHERPADLSAPFVSPEPFRSPCHGRGRSMASAPDGLEIRYHDYRSFQEAFEREGDLDSDDESVIGEGGHLTFEDEIGSALDIPETDHCEDDTPRSKAQTQQRDTQSDCGATLTNETPDGSSFISHLRCWIYSTQLSHALSGLQPGLRLRRIAWWMLGLFLGPSSTSSTKNDRARFSTPTAGERQALLAASKRSQHSFLRSLQLWGKLMFAIVSTMGAAIREGPDAVLPLRRGDT